MWSRKKISKCKSRGFTLIEMIIALSIFVLTVLIATSAYLTINNTQRKTASMQRVQDDVRYLFEAIAQDVRLGTINYDYYAAHSIDLYPTEAANTVLAIVNQSGEQIFYRFSSDIVQYCQGDPATDCEASAGNWQSVTPAGVVMQDIKFAITPSADPFTESTQVLCTAGTGKTSECQSIAGYSCPTVAVCGTPPCYCRYFSDNHSFQPKVRIVLKARAQNLGVSDKAEINIQSTVSSRIMPGKVVNLNYD